MSKIIFFGDIVGKPGRRALAQVLPMWRQEYQPDVVIANVENLAHGKGITEKTLAELDALGFDVYTSGNHVFDKPEQALLGFSSHHNLIRPANYENTYPGSGAYRFQKNGQWYTVINLGGQVFFEKQFQGEIANPFFTVDNILATTSQKGDIILVDFHAEATSEKRAMGYYLDGKVAAVVGTHTHVPTADEQILPSGTAYVTDVGMTGPKDSVIGVKIDNALNMFLEKDRFRMEVEEESSAVVHAVLIETKGPEALTIQRLVQEF